MANFPLLVGLSAVMGLSIFLSLPVVLHRDLKARTVQLLSAGAVGLLVFLLADIFSDVASLNTGSGPYLTDPLYDGLFLLGVGGAYGLLFGVERRRRNRRWSPLAVALIMASAMGFQNLTEGLVFGAAWSVGTLGFLTVVFVGFLLQNFTEGFPIAAPLLGESAVPVSMLVGLYLIGGLPTVVGAAVGFFYSSTPLVIFFDAVAIGAILYGILPMLRSLLGPEESREASQAKQALVYVGIVIGFLVGFLVNAF